MPNASHPIWSLLRLLVLMTALTTVLWLTASKFDSTEIRTICWMFLAAAGVEGLQQLLSKRGD